MPTPTPGGKTSKFGPGQRTSAHFVKNLKVWAIAKTCYHYEMRQEATMPKINLSEMNIEALMDLRERVDGLLSERRAELEQQLERMGVIGGRRVVRGGGGSPLRGRKVPPRYRSRSGETWAGRGARPRWLVAAIKRGRKLDDFLIDKSARKGRKKGRSKC